MGEMKNSRKISVGIQQKKDNLKQQVVGGITNIKTDSRHIKAGADQLKMTGHRIDSMMGFCENGDETTDSAMFINTIFYGDTKFLIFTDYFPRD